jgi:pimeloyl-ACP methyl ester carboxylesterase
MQLSREDLITHSGQPQNGMPAKTGAAASPSAAWPRCFRLGHGPIALPPTRTCSSLALLLLALGATGCGGFMARRMAQSPNSYPQWFGGLARVELAFDPNFLTNFPARFADVGPPAARLNYRVVEPANYRLQLTSTNRLKHGRPHFTFNFHTTMPGQTNAWTAAPRGTVVLLHGYGLAQFAMTPWAMRLTEDGWRCVLVDLRGHGNSTGRRIYFGVRETLDLSQLLDALARDGPVAEPVVAIGESYGAAVALRWQTVEPRLASVVAIAPYAVLSNAILNICRDYVAWLPTGLVKSGLRKLPAVLQVEPGELDTTTAMARSPVVALFVAGSEDKIAPPTDVQSLFEQATTGSELLTIAHATHEALPYYLNELTPPVLAWLDGVCRDRKFEIRSPSEGATNSCPAPCFRRIDN